MNSPRSVNDVRLGQELPRVEFPLTVYRLVMEAGANRDFNSIHHNSEYARSTGAPDMYANTSFLLGMWERAVRDWIGDTGKITAVRAFRMRRFNTVGRTVTVVGSIGAVDLTAGTATIKIHTEDDEGVTVGPGEIDVELPLGN